MSEPGDSSPTSISPDGNLPTTTTNNNNTPFDFTSDQIKKEIDAAQIEIREARRLKTDHILPRTRTKFSALSIPFHVRNWMLS
jgi:hypothetical protein